MIIRDFKQEDCESINKLGLLIHDKYEIDLNSFSKCKVLEDNNDILGFVTYSILYEKSEILDIVIDPTYRKKGYSKLLMRSVIDDVIKNNCENITLEVNVNNVIAINLYKSFGFKIACLRKNYYNNEDAYLMIKEF